MTIETKFDFGDSVFMLHDPEHARFVVTGIKVLPQNTIIYTISSGMFTTEAYEYELANFAARFAN